jgi:hypothetical protein
MATRAILALCILAASGCTRGFLYTDVVYPLTPNMQMTPARGDTAQAANYGVRIPFTRVPLSAQWSTDALGEAAKAQGIQEIYYADIQRFRVLGGLWQDSSLRIVGKSKDGLIDTTVPID